MHHFTTRRLAGAAAWAVAASALAQTPSENTDSTAVTQLATIVVTPTRAPEPLGSTLGDNSVISRETLDSLPNGTLADALIREHSIEAVNYGGPQTVSTINIRGTNSNQSLILIDGMRVNNATNGLPPLNAIPLNSIERVEIVRGTSSSLYGSDAIGGVVNIITRAETDRPFSAYANAGVGTYASTQYDAGFSGAKDGWSYSLFGGYGQSAGFNSTRPNNYYQNGDTDSYYRSNLGGSLGYTWKPGQTLTFQTLQSRVNGGYDMGTPYFGDRGIQTLSNNVLTSRNVISSFWTSTLRAGFNADSYQTVNAGAQLAPSNPPDGKQHFKTNQSQYVWQNDLTFSPTQVVSLAYERLEQRVDGTLSDNNFPVPSFVNYQQTSRSTNSLLGIYRGKWGAQSVQASVRNDDSSQYGNVTTGSLTYGLDLTSRWRATVGANTGFRAPNFNELYWPVTPFFVGNPFLQPERSRNIEAGLKYTTDKTQLGLTLYRNDIDNLILNEPSIPSDPYSPYTPRNIDRALITGITLTGSQRLGSDTVVRGSFDWSNPRNASTGELLPQRAQRVFKMAVDQSIGRARLTGEFFVTSQRRDAMTSDTLGGFGLMNLVGSYPLTDNAEIQVRWNNVFARQYTLVQGYATPGSNVFVNLALKM
ncbi:TonB-dependent receptor domain-containing protein [Zwartia sp.]|uniref:TonB-dependent receptor plug domain-containing protein n=1 Tax=Zwartia sp. TaxID=2978004 RepID=UPI00271FDCEF|nr:TonB-dependent receptor [Zwartia sp.]MDO9025606.1 TonB-dependent receptor [Zwartia sp.]